MIHVYNQKYETSYFLSFGGLIMFIFTVITCILFGFTFYQACINLTTNERLNQMRYDYLKDCNDRFYNPFDQGLVQNLREFFHLKPPLTLKRENLQASIV